MPLLIFENKNYKQLYPIAYTRPTFDTILGMSSLLDKILGRFSTQNVSLFCRDFLRPMVKRNYKKYGVNVFPKGDEVILIDGTVVMDGVLSKMLHQFTKDTVVTNGKQLVAARISGSNLKKLKGSKQIDLSLVRAPKKKVPVKVVQYIWETILINSAQLKKDFAQTGKLGIQQSKPLGGENSIFLVQKENIYIAPRVELFPLVTIDAKSGPVYIERGTTIAPNVIIRGPVYIGKNCTINSGAKILPGTTIGESSKVGGEIAETIIHGFSNKQHDGFLGHSYIGTWCNLGANTNNSDLKNNYSPVSIQIGSDTYDTQQLFAGIFMGDHSKTGINTMLNTGTVIGAGCNIIGTGYPRKFVPSFTWDNQQHKPVTHAFDKFIATAKVVCKRRNVMLTAADKKLYAAAFTNTSIDRTHFNSKR
ncbi:MAG: putative sugar nucleotidyl transferase [Patescibacteria group bacterium]